MGDSARRDGKVVANAIALDMQHCRLWSNGIVRGLLPMIAGDMLPLARASDIWPHAPA